jgi:hypothetical protein
MNRLVLLVLGLFIASNSCRNYTTEIPTPDVAPIEIPLKDPYEGFKVIAEDQDEYSCVGQVLDKDGMVGSAVAIGGNVVITAGHCVDGNKLTHFKTNSEEYTIIKQVLHPNYKIGETILVDIAVLFVDREVCVDKFPEISTSRMDLTRFENVTTVGFSKDKKKSSKEKTFYYHGILMEDLFNLTFNSTKGYHIWFGDSGGALFEDGGKLAGILVSFAIIDYSIIEMSAIRLDITKPWIDTTLKENKDIWVK